jgi:hypothetical protein
MERRPAVAYCKEIGTWPPSLARRAGMGQPSVGEPDPDRQYTYSIDVHRHMLRGGRSESRCRLRRLVRKLAATPGLVYSRSSRQGATVFAWPRAERYARDLRGEVRISSPGIACEHFGTCPVSRRRRT